MDREIERRKRLCAAAVDSGWEDRLTTIEDLTDRDKAFLKDHPPGLIAALWEHFAATRGQCGCTSPAHENPRCTVRPIERLQLDEEVG